MALRKSFSGDRETAFRYLGLAQSRLGDLKRLMQIGGLQQLLRTFTLPNGVQVMVASVMGQDYISIDVPVQAASAPTYMVTPQEAAEVVPVTEYAAEKIEALLQKTFSDTVHSTGTCTVEITRVIPTPPEIIVVGTAYFPPPTNPHAFWYSSRTGELLYVLHRDTTTSSTALTVSSDGQMIAGAVTDSRPGNINSSALPTMWRTPRSTLVGAAIDYGDAVNAVRISADKTKIFLVGQYATVKGEWNEVDGARAYFPIKGDYSHPYNAAPLNYAPGENNFTANSVYGSASFHIPVNGHIDGYIVSPSANDNVNAVAFPQPSTIQTSTIVISG